jgi:hypothetical protein
MVGNGRGSCPPDTLGGTLVAEAEEICLRLWPSTYLAVVKDSTNSWSAQPSFHFRIFRSLFCFNGVPEVSASFIERH